MISSVRYRVTHLSDPKPVVEKCGCPHRNFRRNRGVRIHTLRYHAERILTYYCKTPPHGTILNRTATHWVTNTIITPHNTIIIGYRTGIGSSTIGLFDPITLKFPSDNADYTLGEYFYYFTSSSSSNIDEYASVRRGSSR